MQIEKSNHYSKLNLKQNKTEKNFEYVELEFVLSNNFTATQEYI